jgi:hypothetical protein
VSPSIKEKKGKYFIYFTINTNVNIDTIYFNGKKLKIKERTTESYFTKGRRVKNLDKTYMLELEGEGFELFYECRIDTDLKVRCDAQQRPEL